MRRLTLAGSMLALVLGASACDPSPPPADAGTDSGLDGGPPPPDGGIDAGPADTGPPDAAPDGGTCRGLPRPPTALPRPPTEGRVPDELRPPGC